MADTAETGVVDFRGRVFDRSNGRVIPGLYVMDGSIVPCALETNPFLTISALAEHSINKLIELDIEKLLSWQSKPIDEIGCAPSTLAKPSLPPRPLISRTKSKATQLSFEFKERLRAKLTELQGLDELFEISEIDAQDLSQGLVYLEFQLSYRPKDLKQFLAQAKHQCDLEGELRLIKRKLSFPAFADEDWEQIGHSVAIESGSIQLFVQTSKPSMRNALRAGLIYRERRFKREQGLDVRRSLRRTHVPSLISFLGHVGVTREVRYDFALRSHSGELIRGKGCKPIRYRRDSNVWKDLFNLPMRLEKGERCAWQGSLSVDVDYFLTEGIPNVKDQKNLPESLLNIASYGMFYLWVILSTYFYEFGPPDYPNEALDTHPMSSPLEVQGLVHEPKHFWLPVGEFGQVIDREPSAGQEFRDSGRDFEQKLAKLDPKNQPPSDPGHNLISAYETKKPKPLGSVLLLHGYAISSSMWSSPRIGKSMVQSLLEASYDVYVVDLRTSSSLSALINHAVSFDAVAAEDIPCLIEFVWQKNQTRRAHKGAAQKKIHVIAHCMGSAQFSMALLAQAQASQANGAWSRNKARFELSKDRIAKACFFKLPRSWL